MFNFPFSEDLKDFSSTSAQKALDHENVRLKKKKKKPTPTRGTFSVFGCRSGAFWSSEVVRHNDKLQTFNFCFAVVCDWLSSPRLNVESCMLEISRSGNIVLVPLYLFSFITIITIIISRLIIAFDSGGLSHVESIKYLLNEEPRPQFIWALMLWLLRHAAAAATT